MGQLTLKNRTTSNYLLLSLLLCAGIIQVSASYYFSNTSVGNIIHYLTFPASFSLGPLIYFYFKEFIDTVFAFRARHLLHLVPCVMASTVITILKADRSNEVLMIIIMHLGMITVLGYMVAMFLKLYSIYRRMNERKMAIFPGLIMLVAMMIGYMLWLVGIMLSREIMRVGYVFIGMIIFFVFFISNRHPEYLRILRMEAIKQKYSRSQLKNIDVASLMEHLEETFLNEKAHCYEKISLEMLAGELSITSHQLSEIINKYYNKNFYQLINEYRIRDAQEILLKEPDRSVLSVGTAVGFNSPSSFYKEFKRITGMTPSDFRKKNIP